MTEGSGRNGLSLLNPPGLYDPAPNGYSHVTLLPPGARLAFIAGQGGETADGWLSALFGEQVRQALKNLCTAIEAAGGTPQQIAKLTVLIVDHSEARLQVFGEELVHALGRGPKPACTLIPVPRLALDGMLFEVEAVVLLDEV
ncbi:RidA family protein [Stutzerimonas nitrititolerans]|uniref:RidA family protein n=1 Tax=Stutzerimonas nitrititolerans TaxID=2482751 RepID=UPI0028AB3110|nr:RidA family protein [Stutzerimonas nitrititolerans]